MFKGLEMHVTNSHINIIFEFILLFQLEIIVPWINLIGHDTATVQSFWVHILKSDYSV